MMQSYRSAKALRPTQQAAPRLPHLTCSAKYRWDSDYAVLPGPTAQDVFPPSTHDEGASEIVQSTVNRSNWRSSWREHLEVEVQAWSTNPALHGHRASDPSTAYDSDYDVAHHDDTASYSYSPDEHSWNILNDSTDNGSGNGHLGPWGQDGRMESVDSGNGWHKEEEEVQGEHGFWASQDPLQQDGDTQDDTVTMFDAQAAAAEDPEPHADEEPTAEDGNLLAGNSQFAAVLKEALNRQKSLLEQTNWGGSDDEDTTIGYEPPAQAVATPYVPKPPPRKELSPLSEVIMAALTVTRQNLQRFIAVKNEMESAIEREVKQLERLEFALQKSEGDAAWLRSLERQLQAEQARARSLAEQAR